MKIIDTHCDALYRLQKHRDWRFRDAPRLDTNLQRLTEGGIMLQFFAIFLEPKMNSDHTFQSALEQIDIFRTEVIGKNPSMKQIRNWQEIGALKPGEIGAVLTIEGAEPIGNDPAKLRLFYELGVLSIGLTWNHANLCADGAEEPRGGGLTVWGREVVRQNNAHYVFTDVSHLSEQAFWDVMESADYPIASHSNAKALCGHARNLTDAQIYALSQKGGFVNAVFYPEFLRESGPSSIKDVVRHIDHLCSLAGPDRVGFGSDFDGIEDHVPGLEHAGRYGNLINELLKYYTEDQVAGFASRNILGRLPGVTWMI